MSMIGRIAMAVFALGAFAVLSPATAYANCSDAEPSLCSKNECLSRNATAHDTCDSQPRSCKNVDSSNKSELQARLLVNRNCLAARQHVQKCFRSTNTSHVGPIKDAQAAIATCESKIAE